MAKERMISMKIMVRATHKVIPCKMAYAMEAMQEHTAIISKPKAGR